MLGVQAGIALLLPLAVWFDDRGGLLRLLDERHAAPAPVERVARPARPTSLAGWDKVVAYRTADDPRDPRHQVLRFSESARWTMALPGASTTLRCGSGVVFEVTHAPSRSSFRPFSRAERCGSCPTCRDRRSQRGRRLR